MRSGAVSIEVGLGLLFVCVSPLIFSSSLFFFSPPPSLLLIFVFFPSPLASPFSLCASHHHTWQGSSVDTLL